MQFCLEAICHACFRSYPLCFCWEAISHTTLLGGFFVSLYPMHICFKIISLAFLLGSHITCNFVLGLYPMQLCCEPVSHADLFKGDGGWDVAQLVGASDCHAAGADSIPWCGKGFSSQSAFSADSLLVLYTPVCNCMHYHLCTR